MLVNSCDSDHELMNMNKQQIIVYILMFTDFVKSRTNFILTIYIKKLIQILKIRLPRRTVAWKLYINNGMLLIYNFLPNPNFKYKKMQLCNYSLHL